MMITIVGVRFKQAGKVYYFDPNNLVLSEGMHVIVETARGLEFGTVSSDPGEISERSVVKPLKKVVRIADEKDLERHAENMSRKQGALEACQKKIDEHGLDMKLIDVEYTFDNSKVVFYFTADGRIDFRNLVKDLAGIFRMRIELRQVGVRDEARMLGGIGTCGRGLCCHTWLGRFNPVSIKMAKNQGLSLNPTKISGICGRLMCCLKYEDECYMSLKKGMPDPGERVRTPEGTGVVESVSLLKEQVNVRLVENESGSGNRKDHGEEEVLSQDVYSFNKNEIRRSGKNRGARKHEEPQETALPEELKKLED